MPTTRRFTLSALMTLPLIGRASTPTLAQNGLKLPLTLSCDDGHDATLDREAGPYFRPNSPNKRDLYADAPGGERITVAGFVFDKHCRPVSDSLVEIWHADEHGDYDSTGFKYAATNSLTLRADGGSTRSCPHSILGVPATFISRCSVEMAVSSPPSFIFQANRQTRLTGSFTRPWSSRRSRPVADVSEDSIS